MKVLKLFVYSIVINNLFVFSALASVDTFYCDFSLTLYNSSSCNNLPFLSPFNDSRTNLILLTNSPKAQQATLATLTSPQSQAPYLANAIKNSISAVPFTITTYDNYLDDLTHTKQLTQIQTAKKLDKATLEFIGRVKQAYLNNSTIKNKAPKNNNELFISPALAYFKLLAKTENLNEQERLALGLARYILFNNKYADITPYLPKDPSFTAKHFINYLLGANAFYKGNYYQANKYFIEASQAFLPWIQETAIYMLARNELNKGQAVAYNNWGELDLAKIDQTAIKHSYNAFHHYLKLYPKGLYVNSSSGLLRRIYWLQKNKTALALSYERLLNTPAFYINANTSVEHSLADLILEIDNKVYFNNEPITANDLLKTPRLLAVYDLLKMRSNTLTMADLEAQKNSFNRCPELYNYLLATYYTYIEPNPDHVLGLLPELANDLDTVTSLALSEQVLRILALEAKGDYQQAEHLWLALKPLAKQAYQVPLIELGLALNNEKSGQIDKAFSQTSILPSQLRYTLLRQNADHNQLEQLINNTDTPTIDKAYIIYLLLYKDLLTGQYETFLANNSLLVSAGVDTIKLYNISKLGTVNLELFSEAIPSHSEYACPSPIILANILKLNPYDARALNCLGEFKEHYFLPFNSYMTASSLAINHKNGALGTNKPTSFGIYLYSRLKGYQHVIADETADDEDKAYALYKAIRCFSNTGENKCDKQNIPKTERQQWFRQLHTKYAKTLWAKQQTIYW